MSTKLLLADDSATIQRVIGLTFAGLDVEVIVAGDGDEAIARIALEKPDIVLADIGMPKRSGYDVSAFVKNHPELGRVPVVLLAGAFEPVNEVRAREVRCDGVLVKPLEPQQVISTVHDLLGRARTTSSRASVDRFAPGVVDPPLRAPAPRAFDDEAILDSALDDYFKRINQPFSAATLPDVALTQVIEAGSVQPELRLVADLADPFLVGRMDRAEFAQTPAVREAAVVETSTGMPAPLLEDLLSNESFPDVRLAAEPVPTTPTNTQNVYAEPDAGAVARSKRSVVAQAFNAMLAAENGERPAAPIRFGAAGTSAVVTEAVVTEAMVDDLVKRVLERLSQESFEHVNAIVRRVILDVAGRLAREEVNRMRAGQPAAGSWQ
jgi:CheY-like chemotaxis protein/nitrogen regulatory protein PII-like uncharacterized protein